MTILRIKQFLKLEAASGIILFVAALLGLFLENSPWSHIFVGLYSFELFPITNHLPNTPQNIINEGLMTLFFLLITLEIKRELLIGELNSRKKAVLPAITAMAGMAVPVIIYVVINFNYPHYIPGWAIPTPTDVAFSLAILSLLGPRIPTNLKIFLLAFALMDDIGAIIIIAFFYAEHIQVRWLYLTGILFSILMLLNYFNINRFLPYVITGIMIWFCCAFSGIHPTIAGVLIALAIPLNSSQESLLRKAELKLHPYVAYGILPLFALVNAGFSFSSLTLSEIFSPISMGIILGLFLGKQLGIFIASWLSIKFNIAHMPSNVNLKQIYGIAVLGGVGFTMSLYIDSLAFGAEQVQIHVITNFAIVVGSILSGVMGYFLLRYASSRT